MIGAYLCLCIALPGLGEKARYTLIMGKPQDPHASVPLQHELLLGYETERNCGSKQLPFYTDPDTYTVRHQLLRTHIPLAVVSRGIQKPATGVLLYRFKFESTRIVARYTRKTRKKRTGVFKEYGPYSFEKSTSNLVHITPWQWNVIPLNKKKKIECILKPQEFVACEREVWDASRYIIKSSRGEYCVFSSSRVLRQLNDNLELEEDDQEFTAGNIVGNISTYAFPFVSTYRRTRTGIAGKWPETEFPAITMRSVYGNESWKNCKCEAILFTPEGVVFSKNIEESAKGYFLWQLLQTHPGIDRDWVLITPEISMTVKEELPDVVAMLAEYCVQHPVSQRGRTAAARYLKIKKEEKQDTLKDIARQLLKCGVLSKQLVQQYLKTIAAPAERVAVLQGMIKSKPQTVCLYECLAIELLAQKEWRRAAAIIGRWSQLEPENSNVDLAKYHAATGMNHEQEASRALGRVLERVLRQQLPHLPLTPSKCTAPNFLLGQLYETAGKHDKALMVYRMSIDKQETNYIAQLGMARVYMAAAKPEAVIHHCRKVLTVHPDHPEALRLLVLSYGYKEKEEKAQEAYADLIRSISGIIEERVYRDDWHSVWSLAEYALQDMTQIVTPKTLLYAIRMKVVALIHLKQYEEASSVLRTFGRDPVIQSKLSDLWALLYSVFNEDPHTVVISKKPFDWNERAIKKLRTMATAEDEYPVMHLMTTLLALKRDDEQAACRALMTWYDHAPTEWLAGWIGDICLQIEERYPGRTLDHTEYKTYLEAALDFYSKTGKEAKKGHLIKESPMTYIGLSRAYRRNGQEGLARYTLKKCREIYPGFPELWREELEDIFKPETPCHLTNKILLNTYLQYRPNDCALYERLNKKLIIRSDEKMKRIMLNKWSKAESGWQKLIHPRIHKDSSRTYLSELTYKNAEIRKPVRVFTVRLHPMYEAELTEYTTIIPNRSILWYAVRSRYKHKDLRFGMTRYWRYHRLVNSEIYHGKYEKELGEERGTTKIDLLMKKFDWNPGSPDAYYRSERKFCFYQWVKNLRKKRITKLGGVASQDNYPGLHFGIPYDRRMLPEQLRSYFIPPEVMDVLWKETESRLITFGDMLNWQRSRVCPFWVLPRDGSLLTWRPPRREVYGNVGTSAEVFGGNGVAMSGTVYLSETGSTTNERNTVNIKALTITPLPFSSSWTAWPDEGVRIFWEQLSSTSAHLRVYVKSYQREHGIEGNGGIAGEWTIPVGTHLEWVLDGQEIRVTTAGSDTDYTLKHLLSPFAWKNGVYVVRDNKI